VHDARFGVDQERAVDGERDGVLEKLAAGGGRFEARRELT
jgi:hypothetical protein